jgi:hypothetical protein
VPGLRDDPLVFAAHCGYIPGGVTVAVVMVVVLAITAPFVAVLLMNGDSTLSTFLKAYAMGVGIWVLGVSVGTLRIAPVAVVLERFTLRGGALRMASAVCRSR